MPIARGVRCAAVLTGFVLTPLLIPSASADQDARGYVGAGAALSPWRPQSNSSGASLAFLNTSDQDWAPALQLEAGAFVSRTVSLGVEFVLPSRRDLEQAYSYYPFGYLAEIRYREAPLFALVRWHPRGRVTGMALVAGAGPVRQDGLERRAQAQRVGSGYGPFGRELQAVRWTLGATAGIDIALPLGERVSLVPEARAMFIARGETFEEAAFADLGLPRSSYRLALTLRTHF